MTILCSKKCISLSLLFFSILGFAQHLEGTFLQPQFVLSHQQSNSYAYNFGLAHRLELSEGEERNLNTRFLELSHFSTFTVGDEKRISLGILYRFIDFFNPNRRDELRFTQQYTFVKKYNVVRYSHRFRTEERFIGDNFLFRLRYRFGIDLPLSGQILDVGEYYILSNLEGLWITGNERIPRYDIRFSAGLGKRINPKTKIQLVFQYRLENVYREITGELFFLLGGYLKL